VHAYISVFEYGRWALVIALEVCLAGIVIRRQVYRRFPVFSIYAVLLGSRSLLLLAVSLWGSPDHYFITYWLSGALTGSVLLCVIMELVTEVCLPGALTSEARMRTLIVICLTAAFAAAIATQHDVPPTNLAILNTLIASEKAFGYATFSVLGCLLIFSGCTGVTWPRPAAAIAAGIVLCTALSAVIDCDKKYFPGPIRTALALISTLGTAATIGIWLAAFWKVETGRDAEPQLPARLRTALNAAESLRAAISIRRSWQ